MSNSFNIQWYPGHMKKAKISLIEYIRLVDATVEIRDARIPLSSCNPDVDDIISRKKRIILLNKCDLSDSTQNKKWVHFFKQKGLLALETNCKSGYGLNKFSSKVQSYLASDINKLREKGIRNKKIKLLIVGIPNVGKSSFINRISKNSKAKVENRPGVTRQNQWYTVDNTLELLDTPGVLWPKFEDKLVSENLAFTGCIKDEILDNCALASVLLERLKEKYVKFICNRYNLKQPQIEDLLGYDMLAEICKSRSMLKSGGEIDIDRAANTILREFREGKLGKITLETIPGELE